ncbi:MAG TPA: hypothetical protein VJ461_02755 [Candidatus Nanoarchaeia archaeon]|nr:hypothetical protein [Candidatus Nanoarchaeia archaeon]
MGDLIKYGLIAGSVYILAKALTKDKVLSEKNVRNTALGGGLGYIGGPKLEDMLNNNKKQAAYIAGGAIAGYVAEKLMVNGSLKKAIDYSKDQIGIKQKASA